MFLKQFLLFLLGASAGGIIAAGIFAFLAIIGIFPRLIGVTGTKNHIMLCETMMIVGGVFGNLMNLFWTPQMPVEIPTVIRLVLLGTWGTATGIFVGCLVMSLAETLKALPVLSRRIHLSVGIQYVILAVAFGKFAGAMVYFLNGFGL